MRPHTVSHLPNLSTSHSTAAKIEATRAENPTTDRGTASLFGVVEGTGTLVVDDGAADDPPNDGLVSLSLPALPKP
jgi:hypothetical protein